jgi:hypothetical protein
LNINTTKTTKDKIYNVWVTVSDPNTKKSISANTSFKLLNSDIFVWMKFNKYYYDFWDDAKIDFATVDIDWNKKWNKNLNLRVYKIDYIHDENTYKVTKEEKLLLEKNLVTNYSWDINFVYNLDKTWEYRFEVELANKKYKTTKTIYVSWFNLIKPVEQEHNISILKDKDIYNIWDNAEFVIQSEVVWVKALVTVEKLNKIFYSKIIDINDNSQIFNLPIKKEYLPNFELKIFILKNVENSSNSLEELKNLRLEMIDLEEELKNSAWWEGIIIPFSPICFDIVDKGWFIYPPSYNNSDFDKDLLEKLVKLRQEEQSLLQKILPNYFIW